MEHLLQVRGKGDKDRRIPVDAVLVDVLERNLDSRKILFPTSTRRCSPTGGLAGWPADAPLFVGGDGQRVTRGTLQYRVLRAFRQAGIDGTRAKGALLHGFRHTFATELANADVSVYVLMNLPGSRVDDHLPALYQRRGHRHPRRSGEEWAVRDRPQYRMTPTTAESARTPGQRDSHPPGDMHNVT